MSKEQELMNKIDNLSTKLTEAASGFPINIAILSLLNLLIQTLNEHSPSVSNMLTALKQFFLGMFNGSIYDPEQN